MKTCPKCRTEKKLSEFYRDKYRKDGLCCCCKACMMKYQQSEAGKEARKKNWQSEAGKATHKKAATKYWKTKEGKESKRKSDAKHRKAFPEKEKAHYAIRRALKTGQLFKEPCPCGETKVEGHHEDYSKPLDVDWTDSKDTLGILVRKGNTKMKTAIIDFDGTLCEHKYPEVGRPEPHVKEALEKLKEMGYEIIIHSCRTAVNWGRVNRIEHIKKIEKFMKENKLPYDEILTDSSYDKPIADVYIDNRGVGYRGNWQETIAEVEKLGYLNT